MTMNLLTASVRCGHGPFRRAGRPFAATRHWYFTNTDEMKKDDPYSQLGLQWGDATSTKDIKDAFRQKARELHPDVNTTDSPEAALKKFQALQKAYQTLLGNADDANDGVEEWRFAVWRGGDRLAQDRTDVAGLARKRPVQPASKADVWAARQLGHPDGRGSTTGRAEYLTAGSKPISSSVGTGQNKWVAPKPFKPWNPEESHKVRASHFAKQQQQPSDHDKQ
ncbi:ATP binding to DnaK triggers the release of the substrate protein [Seminavis robusta]|uniref:ATP binding to DnaK triggers the release of the substrate protein n=1 Tax=Seminavis robusta TaxID=568900 RepID=A0A9N8H709_9STRA|nr:ATP binding to DnaK triggers the release of the substrate protein [Seminavis robusta]|eukprot:Sro163_g073300.1 ATP binding to DnaK triggers the release of the substrate protein (223) ;mRNA; r:66543-67211